MAIKPFEIQSPSLVLAGVQMQAGATGVVIPGVTQATSYSVNEVEDTGDQTVTWPGIPNIIDNGRYTILNGGPEPAGYVISEYTAADLDGDSYITEIQVDTAGSFPASYQSTVVQNMWATSNPDPFSSFNPSDWTQIPFAPVVRAGEIETLGGTGNALSNGDNTFTLSDTTAAALTLSNTNGERALIQIQPDDSTLLIDSLNGNIVLSANDSTEYTFDTTGNLTVAGNIVTSGPSGNITGANVISGVTLQASSVIETTGTGGSITMTGGDITGANTVSVNTSLIGNVTRPGHLSWVANSSGDGNNFTTIELQPDNAIGGDSYLIIDPTAPNHLHLRAGGTQDNSSTQLYLGGEQSYFMVDAGSNPSVNIRANGNNWQFSTSGNLTIPGSISADNYNSPNVITATASDPNWAFGFYSNGSTEFYTQAKFYGNGELTRGVRFMDTTGNTFPFSIDGTGNLNVLGDSYITTGNGVSGAGGKSITIAASASDTVTWNSNPGGDVNIRGGYGSFGDGGGGPGGNVNIYGGLSSDTHSGNVTVNTGGGQWTFDYNGVLTTSGTISTTGSVTAGSVTVTGAVNANTVNLSTSTLTGTPYVGPGITIGSSELANATPGAGATLVGTTFTSGGFPASNGGLNFTNSASLTSAIVAAINGGFPQLPVVWSVGSTRSTGFAYFEITGGDSFSMIPVTDGAGSPDPGTWQFPATFGLINASVTIGVAGGHNWVFSDTNNLTAPGDITTTGSMYASNFYAVNAISATGNITGGNVAAGKVVTGPVALANLTAVAGARAFVNNANLVAAGNFGAQISGGGSNTVPVWSDGTNWYIG